MNYVAGAVSTDAALAPTCAAVAPTGTNTAALAANAAPAAPVTNAAALYFSAVRSPAGGAAVCQVMNHQENTLVAKQLLHLIIYYRTL